MLLTIISRGYILKLRNSWYLKMGCHFCPTDWKLADTMQVIIGTNAQPKLAVTEKDLPVPQENYYDLTAYYPLQYSLPLTYGVGFSWTAFGQLQPKEGHRPNS